MKRFFAAVGAFLTALVILLTGLILVGRLNEWTHGRNDLLTRLVVEEQRYQLRKQKAELSGDDDPVEVSAADIAHTKLVLINSYQGKPWFLSSVKRQQLKRLQDDVATFNGRGRRTTREVLVVKDFPAALPAIPPSPRRLIPTS